MLFIRNFTNGNFNRLKLMYRKHKMYKRLFLNADTWRFESSVHSSYNVNMHTHIYIRPIHGTSHAHTNATEDSFLHHC